MSDLFPNDKRTIEFVKVDKNLDGWPVAFTGNSLQDGEDYGVVTNQLKADQVPDVLTDAKSTAELIVKLLNQHLSEQYFKEKDNGT